MHSFGNGLEFLVDVIWKLSEGAGICYLTPVGWREGSFQVRALGLTEYHRRSDWKRTPPYNLQLPQL